MNERELQQMEIILPFRPRRHPGGTRAQCYARTWATRFELLPDDDSQSRFDTLGYGRFASYWCPTAAFVDLVLLVEWITLFFTFDDLQDLAMMTDNVGEYDALRYAALDVVHRRPRRNGDNPPVIAALENLCGRTFPRQNSDAARRFALNLEIWLVGHARENVFRYSATTPSLAEYARLRRDASTVLPTVDLTEIAERAVIPDALYFGPSYQEIIATTADIMCWINDLHSLSVETVSEDPINLVTVLRRHSGLNLEDAVAEVRKLIESRVEDNRAAVLGIRSEMDTLNLDAQVRHAVERCIRNCHSATAGMELWDRTDTVRFTGNAPRFSHIAPQSRSAVSPNPRDIS
ncbi:hypothetical protein ACFVUS_28245 [Nocardia sp. NPDC058058]|uniref:terpene synthase family protein n=1 Tax=Nocardia sp. NPDC058058 TaxID=3346317 RepID=UPI0036DAB86D